MVFVVAVSAKPRSHRSERTLCEATKHYTYKMGRISATSKAVKPVERSRETPTVPGSEGIDGVNGGGDSSATFFEAAASCR